MNGIAPPKFLAWTAGWNEQTFARFCNTLIVSMARKHFGAAFDARLTDRVKDRDEGEDASVRVEERQEEASGGIVGPGLSVYQYKFSDLETDRKRIREAIHKEVGANQLARVRQRHPDICRYVLIVNRDLGAGIAKLRRDLEERFTLSWGSNPPRFTLLGGGELDALRADYPGIFMAFGANAELETNSERIDALDNIGRPLGAPRHLVNRLTEVKIVQEFVDREIGGLLFVTSPPGMGKSTLVARAVADSPKKDLTTFWLLLPHQEPRRALKALADQECSAVVFDGIESRDEARRIIDLSQEFPQLRRIFLLREEMTPSEPSAEILRLQPLEFDAAQKVLQEAGIQNVRLRGWLYELAGGVPGVLLAYGSAVREVQAGVSREDLLARVDKKISEIYLGDDPEEAKAALWIALCGLVDLDCPSAMAVRLANSVGLEVATPAQRQRLYDIYARLAARGVVKKLGPLVRFEAHFLARPLVKCFLAGKPRSVLEAFVRSAVGDWARILGLLEAERDDPDIRQLAGRILESFESLEQVASRLDLFVAAGRINSEEAARQAERLFVRFPDKLSVILRDTSCWKILDFLKQCLHEASESAEYAVGALIEATIAEGAPGPEGHKRKLPVADEYLLPLWGRLHWQDIPLPFERRFAFIQKLADDAEPSRRLLAVKAAVAVLQPLAVDYHSTQQGLALPRTEAMPVTWSDVFRYSEDALRLLVKLGSDRHDRVADEAFKWACKCIAQATLWGASPETLQEALTELSRIAQKPTRRNLLRSGVQMALRDLDRATRPDDERGQRAKQVLGDAAVQLRSTSFGDRLVEIFSDRQVPEGGGPSFWEWTHAPSGRLDPNGVGLFEEAQELARQAVRNPEVISADLHQVLAGASHGGVFWWLVGQEDSEGRWRAQLDDPAFPWKRFLSDYVGGWTAVQPDDADSYLEKLVARPEERASIVWSTGRQPPTSRRARRLNQIVEADPGLECQVAGVLGSGPWLGRLDEDAAAPLLERLANSANENVLARVLRTLEFRVNPMFQGSTGPRTRDLAWKTLRTLTDRRGSKSLAWEWQYLAATMSRVDDVAKAFQLVEQLADRDPVEMIRSPWLVDFRSVFQHKDLSDALSDANRPRLAALWLQLAHKTPEPWRGLLAFERPLDSERDRDAILQFVADDPSRSTAIWPLVGERDTAYLQLLRDVLERVPRTEELWNAAFRHFAFGEAFFGPPSLHMAGKIQALRDSLLVEKTSLAYSSWANWAIREIEGARRLREQWEFVRAFHDGKPTAEEATAILESPQADPQRRWLVRRLLEHEKPVLARELLGDEEIEAALQDDPDLDPRVAKLWRERLGRSVSSWKS